MVLATVLAIAAESDFLLAACARLLCLTHSGLTVGTKQSVKLIKNLLLAIVLEKGLNDVWNPFIVCGF